MLQSGLSAQAAAQETASGLEQARLQSLANILLGNQQQQQTGLLEGLFNKYIKS